MKARLQIDAVDGTQVIDSQLSGPTQLVVGKRVQGDTLTMNINQCNSGWIGFVATFWGTNADGALCEAATRRITKTCN